VDSKRILVVDDDRANRNAIGQLLRIAGYAVFAAANGREALECLRRHPRYDLILLDMHMPVMSGLEFRAEQQQDPALSAIPVVVLTALDESAARSLAIGDVGYVQKPVDVEDLLQLIAQYMVPEIPSEIACAND